MNRRMTLKKKKLQKNSDVHVPMRTCIACRKRLPKRELVRFVLMKDDRPVLDETGKMPGRGANLCPETECLEQAISKGAFERNWKTDIDPDLWDDMRGAFSELLEKRNFRKGAKQVKYRIRKNDAETIIGDRITREPVDV